MSLCILFLLIRLPPRSTLFPYTTLFRSVEKELFAKLRYAERAERGVLVLETRAAPTDEIAAWVGQKAGLDRKSTRLNSSHLGISYAVFCLKKKKKNNRRHNRESLRYRTE